MLVKILSALLLVAQTSFFSLSFTSGEGQSIQLDSFQGKKILLVNIATNSPRVSQLAGLQQLQQQYGDSLVVIAFPSNSFGNEPRTDSQIKAFCQSQYNTGFLLAQKSPVTGTNLPAVYQWLTKQPENGVMNQEVIADFQKYLVNGEGKLVGVFAGSVEPMSPDIISTINQN
jgi:glutathione peroxidase